MTQKSLSVTWHDHLQHISGLFQDLYENKKLVDVTLYCTGGSLKAHKIVLSACSPYFAKIFQENEFQHPIIILKGITFQEMHHLLEFMYKGSINILENELDSLIQAGSYLEIKGMNVKNIPSNMKSTSKRPADEPANEPNNVLKKIKEDLQENDTSDKKPKQLQTKEPVSDIVKEQAAESPVIEIEKPESTENPVSAETPTLTEKSTTASAETPTSTGTPTSTPTPTSTSHGRETRFKGQKRVDVHMFSRLPKYKSGNDEISKLKTNHEDVSSSPKHSKGKLNNDAKGKLHQEDSPFSRVRTKVNNSPITIKKEKTEDKFREKESDQEKKNSGDKLTNDDVGGVYSRVNKQKFQFRRILPKKFPEDSKKQSDKNLDHSENSEDAISKIVIKDVFSTEEMKTSTPKTYGRAKSKIPEKKETTISGTDDKEIIPVTPDIIMNESDSELHCAADEHDDDHYGDDDDDVNEDDESDMLKVSHLECSQCNNIYKTDEEFAEHMKTHSNKPYKCDYCDSYFQRMSHLIRHRRTHTGEKPFSCRECGKCFSRQDKMKQHIRLHDENEYKPPPHLKRFYEPPLPYDERRGRGRPRKYPYVEKPTEKRPRGRPRKYSLPAPGEHVENYDITNLPFGDFSYLTSPLPDFNDLTIIPVSYLSKSASAGPSSPVIQVKPEKENPPSQNESNVNSETEESIVDTNKNPDKETLISTVKHLNECSIKSKPKPENNAVSIININDKDITVTSNKEELTIININDQDIEVQSQAAKISLPASVQHLGECTIEAVPK